VQIVVVSPSGTNPGGGFGSAYCAYHNWAQYSSTQLLSWTNLPYIPDQGSGCGANLVQNADDGWSIVGGHEYMESVTDPFVNNQTAWSDSQGYEIGDKCAWTNLFTQTTSTGTFAMQPEWDNRTSSCKPASTYPHGHIKLASDTTLCAQGSTTTNSAVTLHSPCDSHSPRTWTRYTDGSLRRWRSTAKCIMPQNGSSADGTPLIMARCTNAANQHWTWSSSTGQWRNGATRKCMRAPTASSGAALVENTCGLTDGTEKFSNI
jgi:Ricin-type beta-trefoil lectin domain